MAKAMGDWFAPGEIRFTVCQCRWLIQNLYTLREAQQWPTEASSYIDIPGTKGISGRAPFTMPIEFAAEITERLEKCGIDGLILLSIECWGESLPALARYFKMSEKRIRRRCRWALRYVSSGPVRRWHTTPKRKGQSYQEFKTGINRGAGK